MPKSRKPQSADAPSANRERRLKTEYQVIVNLPDPLPVTDAELDLLESELADLLSGLLRA